MKPFGHRGDLALSPYLGAQRPGRNSALGQMVDCGCDSGVTLAVHRSVDGRLVEATGRCELFGVDAFGERDSHGPKYRTLCDTFKPKYRTYSEIAESARSAQTFSMDNPTVDPWPERAYVLGLIDAKLAEGVTLEEMAAALGMKSTYSLKTGYRYNKRFPFWPTVKKMAKYFKVPESSIRSGGETGDEDPELEKARVFLTDAMGGDIVSRLTDEQMLYAYRGATALASTVLGIQK